KTRRGLPPAPKGGRLRFRLWIGFCLYSRGMEFTPYSAQLKDKGFAGHRVRKVTLNGGFTCPNLDGTKARGGCTFCDNRGFSPSAGDRAVPIAEQMRKGMDYLRSRMGATRFIAYFQTFSGTYAPVHRLRELYLQALDHPD